MLELIYVCMHVLDGRNELLESVTFLMRVKMIFFSEPARTVKDLLRSFLLSRRTARLFRERVKCNAKRGTRHLSQTADRSSNYLSLDGYGFTHTETS